MTAAADACGAVVGEPPERAPRGPEELGQVAMLDVVQRHDGGRVRARRRHRQRVVDDVERRDLGADALRPPRLQRHRRDPQWPALGDGRVLHLDRGEPLGRVLRPGGHEDRVVGRPDLRERADELARVRLGAAHVAR